VRQLLTALGADPGAAHGADPGLRADAPASAPADTGRPSTGGSPASEDIATAEPTDLQVTQAGQLVERYGDATFTIDDAAHTWRTGVGTARSRMERLLESGLVDRAGLLRSEERPGTRPTRGRPPVLYRLAAAALEPAPEP